MLARAQALEAAGREIIHLEIGQPDTPTFPEIAEAGMRAIKEGHTNYTASAGMPALREAIARKTGNQLGLEIKPSQVVVGPGGQMFMAMVALALVRPGDEVLYPDPGFPSYKAVIELTGGVPVPLPLYESQGFSFTKSAFNQLINERTRLVILNSPNNPTGGLLSDTMLEHVANVTSQYDIWILSDEVYRCLTFEGWPATSIASIPSSCDRIIILDSFSKTYAMTGWRLGYAVMPEDLALRVELIVSHTIGCTATFTQIAGLEALSGSYDQIRAVTADYQRRRDVIVAGLNAIPGVGCQLPRGAFYAFPNISSFGQSSAWMSDYLLEKAGVALLPGTDFGAEGEGYLRLCFANSMENLQIAIERISTALKEIHSITV